MKNFLPDSKDFGKLPEFYHTFGFTGYLARHRITVSNPVISWLPINQECIKQIIEEDNLELLQKEDVEKIKEMMVVDSFFEKDRLGIPLLHHCVMKKAKKCFNFLLLNDADPSKTLKEYNCESIGPYDGWNCMSVAICFGELEMMKILEERGINKFINPSVWEAVALTHRNNLLKILISNKDEINNFEECINKAMIGAVRGKNLKEFTILIGQGANINNAMNPIGYSPLHFAAKKGEIEVVKLLLSKGADINARDNDGCTPLHCAVFRGHKQLAELLLSKGADINAKDISGDTPLQLAKRKGFDDLERLLLSKGAK